MNYQNPKKDDKNFLVDIIDELLSEPNNKVSFISTKADTSTVSIAVNGYFISMSYNPSLQVYEVQIENATLTTNNKKHTKVLTTYKDTLDFIKKKIDLHVNSRN